MRESTVFRPNGDDWINQLTLIYFIGLLGTDEHLTNNAIFTSKLSMLLHDQLDSFSPFAWTGMKSVSLFLFLSRQVMKPFLLAGTLGPDEKKLVDQSGNNKMNNACCDVSEVLSTISMSLLH